MDFDKLMHFVQTGSEKWERIKNELTGSGCMRTFLYKVMFKKLLNKHHLELGLIDEQYMENRDVSSDQPEQSNLVREEIRTQNYLSDCSRMLTFLDKTRLVVFFDDYQLELAFIDKLYKKTRYVESDKPTRSEHGSEAFRVRMVEYFENDLEELFLEVRFPYLDIGLIQKIKEHENTIQRQQWYSPASIRVVIDYKQL